jgi:predicted MFS family arabinose efflux permease
MSRVRQNGDVWRAIAGERHFLVFWGGQQCSQVGNGAYQVALAWLVYRTTRSTAAMGLVLGLNSLPQVVGLSAAGLVADRFSRKHVIMCADGTAAVTVLLLGAAAAYGRTSLLLIASGSAVLGLAQALYAPFSRAIVPDLVPSQRLAQANSLFSVGGSLAGMIGPAVGGILVANGGIPSALVADGASFGLAVLTTLTIRPRESVTHRGAPTFGDIGAGFRYIYRRRWLLAIVAVSALVNFAALAPFAVLIPRQVILSRRGASLLGLVFAVEGGAAVVSAIVIGSLRRQRSPLRAMWLLAATIGVGTGITGLAAQPLPLLLGAGLVGVGLGFSVIENTAIQRHVAPEVLGRVYAVNVAASYAPVPLGYLLADIGAGAIGAGPILFLGGVATLAVVLTVSLWAPAVPATDRPDSLPQPQGGGKGSSP